MMGAYFTSATSDDHQNIYEERVQPGDIILMHAGLYIGDQHHYLGGGPRPIWETNFDGTYYLTANGTPDKPIVIKAAGDGEVVFDGNGAAVLFDLEAANYNYFEGITVRNTDVAFLLGHKKHCWLQRLHPETFQSFQCRPRRAGRLVRLQGHLYRRQ